MDQQKRSELFNQAEDQVLSSVALNPYHDFIMANWSEDTEHAEWVINATEQEILDWCLASEAERDW